MDMLIVLWLCFSALLFSNASWVKHEGEFYAVGDVIIDFMTAQERCSALGAQIADFPTHYDFTRFVGRANLQSNTRYWISTPDAYLSFTCISLSIQSGQNWMLLNSLCSASYQYICQRDAPPNTQVTPPTQSIAPTTTAMAIEANSHLLKTSHSDQTVAPQQIVDSLEPSFETNVLSFSKSLGQLVIHSSVARVSVLETGNTGTFYATSTSVYAQTFGYQQTVSSVLVKSTVQTSHVELSSLCQVCFNSFQKDSTDQNKQSNVSSMSSHKNHTIVVERRTTSRYRRQKTSATDKRTSSKAMGVASILIIATILLLIVAMDIPRLITGIQKLRGELFSVLKS